MAGVNLDRINRRKAEADATMDERVGALGERVRQQGVAAPDTTMTVRHGSMVELRCTRCNHSRKTLSPEHMRGVQCPGKGCGGRML